MRGDCTSRHARSASAASSWRARMLTIYPAGGKPPVVWTEKSPAPADALWLELLNPSDAERAFAENLLGTSLPTREQISGIEMSSRVRAQDDLLLLNVPSFVRAEGGQGAPTPLGFALTPKLLVSQRYAD